MAIKVGTFTKSVAAAPAVQSVTGVGFEPQAVILWSTGQTSLDTWQTHNLFAIGISDGATSRSTCIVLQNAAARSNTARGMFNAALGTCLWDLTTTTIAALTSLDADGFTLTWTTNDAIACYIHYIAIGGDDLDNVLVHPWTFVNAAGNQSVTGVGFRPDLVLHINALIGVGYIDVPAAGCYFGMGAMDNSGREYAIGMGAADNDDPMVSEHNNTNTLCCAVSPGALGAVRPLLGLNYVSMDADGFTVNRTDLPGFNTLMASLCLKGGNYYVGSFDEANAPGNQSIAGIGFAPEGVLFMSGQFPEDNGVPQADGQIGVGAADGTDENASAIWNDSPVGTSNCWRFTETDGCIYSGHGAAARTDEASFVSLDADGFTINWSITTNVTDDYGFIAFDTGPYTPPTPPSTPVPICDDSPHGQFPRATKSATVLPPPPPRMATTFPDITASNPPTPECDDSPHPPFPRVRTPDLAAGRAKAIGGVLCDISAPELTIGTATERISLLNPMGFHIGEWRPRAEATRDTFADSALADYRMLRTYKRVTTVETIPLKLRAQRQDQAIGMTQDLREMLDKARDYWASDWQTEVVYIKARAAYETNARYAVIIAGDLPEDGNPYGQLFVTRNRRAVMDNLNLVLERGPWLDDVPGTGTAIELSAMSDYGSIYGRYFGNVDSSGTRDPTTAEGEVFVVNHQKMANLTHIYVWDQGGAAFWVNNLLDVALPTTLLPNPVINGDIIYFGIDTTMANSGPFCNLVFDIGSTIHAVTTIVWEYWNGAWVALTVQDNTNQDGGGVGVPFDTTGVKSVCWQHPADWAVVAVNGVTGYWVRARVTVSGGAGVPPTQQNRDIYTVSWPYTEIQSTQIGGDLPAAILLKIRNQSDVGGATPQESHRFIIGSRLVSRGDDFAGFINWSDEQNGDDITVTAPAGTSAIVADVETPSGKKIAITNAAAAWTEVAQAVIDNPRALDYNGRFRVFTRGTQTSGAAGDIQLRFRAYIDAEVIYTSPDVVFTNTNDWQLLDFGTAVLQTQLRTLEVSSLTFSIDVYGDGAVDADLYDLALIPVDEWAIDAFSQNGTQIGQRSDPTGTNNYLQIDNITYPKKWVTPVRFFYTDEYMGFWVPVTNGAPELQPEERLRIWFLSLRYASASDHTRSELAITSTLQMQAVQRYHSMRGDR